jgi:UDP:flavonoid glycosyltransferase YjiC (YdhE family)
VNILFSTRPAYGHVYPLMPLALAARAAGHRVTFTTAGAFVPKFAALGFDVHPVGLTIEQARDRVLEGLDGDGMPKGDDGRPDLTFGARLFLDALAGTTAHDLAPLLPTIRPDLVVNEQGEFGAAVVAHAAGIPAVCHSISPRMPQAVIEVLSSHGDLDRLWATYGVPAPTWGPFTGDVCLDIFPRALQQAAFLADPARVPMRPVAHAEPSATVPAWVAACRRPVVYLTLGTVVATDEVLLPAIDGIASLDVEVLLALGSAQGRALGALPTNVHPEPFVDQAGLMGLVDLVVHHGGSGTVLGALASGTPQLLLPKGADQFLNADLVVAADLAAALEPSEATPDAIATLAKVALVDDRPAAEAARQEIAAMPHPADVLDQLVARFG